MASLEKIFEVRGSLIRNDFYVIANDSEEEIFYIDPLTQVYDENNKKLEFPKVVPIGFLRHFFFFYICPYCREIHVDSTTNLNVDNKIIDTKCSDLNKNTIRIQMELLRVEKGQYIGKKDEYEFMERFEK